MLALSIRRSLLWWRSVEVRGARWLNSLRTDDYEESWLFIGQHFIILPAVVGYGWLRRPSHTLTQEPPHIRTAHGQDSIKNRTSKAMARTDKLHHTYSFEQQRNILRVCSQKLRTSETVGNQIAIIRPYPSFTCICSSFHLRTTAHQDPNRLHWKDFYISSTGARLILNRYLFKCATSWCPSQTVCIKQHGL